MEKALRKICRDFINKESLNINKLKEVICNSLNLDINKYLEMDVVPFLNEMLDYNVPYIKLLLSICYIKGLYIEQNTEIGEAYLYYNEEHSAVFYSSSGKIEGIDNFFEPSEAINVMDNFYTKVAFIYLVTKEIATTPQQAIKRLKEKSVNDPDLLFRLGDCYCLAIGVDLDYDYGISLMKQAYELTKNKDYLDRIYRRYLEVNKTKELKDYYYQLLKSNDYNIKEYILIDFFKDRFTNFDIEKFNINSLLENSREIYEDIVNNVERIENNKFIINCYKELDKYNYVYATRNLAYTYLTGKYSRRNYNEYLYYRDRYFKLSEKTPMISKINKKIYNRALKLHENSYSLDGNIDDVIECLKMYGELEDASSLNQIGNIMLNNKNDYEKAFYYYSLATELDIYYSSNLARMYLKGRYVEVDYEKAEYYAKMCDDYLVIGEIYEEQGEYEKAFEAYSKVYENDPFSGDCKEAEKRIGYLYFYGRGVEKDILKAKEHFTRSSSYYSDDDYEEDEYLVKMCDRELELDDEDDYTAKKFILKLDEDNYIDVINEELDELFGYYDNNDYFDMVYSINKTSIKLIKTGLICYYNLYKLQEKYSEEYDFSACIIPLFKALEREIKTVFIDRYFRYLEKNLSHDELRDKVSKLLKSLNLKEKIDYYTAEELSNRFNKFTLNKFSYLVGLKKDISIFNRDDNLVGDNNNSQSRQSFIDKTMLNYLKDEVFSSGFNYNKDGEIINYVLDFNNTIEFLANTLRNPAAHDSLMSLKDAEKTINELFFTKKLLVNLFSQTGYLY